MSKRTFVEIPEEEQARLLAARRRARCGYLLALHILLWCADRRHPTEIAAVLCCSRSSVYRRCTPIGRGRWPWSTTTKGA
jgi:hypothetical protein